MQRKNRIGTIAALLTPLLLFVILFLPYKLLNGEVIVKVFGCGCPQIDENGEIVYAAFNANDFTALFWIFVSVCVTVISAFLSVGKISKKWLRAVYVMGMLGISLVISYCFCQIMMWK